MASVLDCPCCHHLIIIKGTIPAGTGQLETSCAVCHSVYRLSLAELRVTDLDQEQLERVRNCNVHDRNNARIV